ncbi:hypothetical protein [Plantactinospora sp. GCM10030261]|uniref:hypothetical protein n=1 Tax=Plantactinospora sp. GCM10030261 TaxID=3273420 RepID=UPI003606AF66
MYRWIWRHLPFGLPGQLAGSVLLIAGAVSLLWFVIFPWAEPLLPFDDVQVSQDSGVDGEVPDGPPGGGVIPGETGQPGNEHDIPYATHTNNPDPSASPTRSRSR